MHLGFVLLRHAASGTCALPISAAKCGHHLTAARSPTIGAVPEDFSDLINLLEPLWLVQGALRRWQGADAVCASCREECHHGVGMRAIFLLHLLLLQMCSC